MEDEDILDASRRQAFDVILEAQIVALEGDDSDVRRYCQETIAKIKAHRPEAGLAEAIELMDNAIACLEDLSRNPDKLRVPNATHFGVPCIQ
ncbi:hypothetical protein [Marivita sp. XM-24bin2]|jgi:hypothetical protein|uniref:hypothetical protein n=1 Tax=unclassified Marivita TaxID=2632480 RepID=UPI000D7A0334|nr:hypothetical protein [Marivita sp. XM-24bin2]MCR9108970.1 hypothetical protein [Paracoccaceae bacterium]PWL36726.1 MAG: hypothetical protein DCO97_02865 [Marivita sp. XM-24bin2]